MAAMSSSADIRDADTGLYDVGLNIDSDGLLWLYDMACIDADADDFFTASGNAIPIEVLETCRACPVRVDCITHAYENGLTAGYFGGISAPKREKMTLDEALVVVAADVPGTSRKNPIDKILGRGAYAVLEPARPSATLVSAPTVTAADVTAAAGTNEQLTVF